MLIRIIPSLTQSSINYEPPISINLLFQADSFALALLILSLQMLSYFLLYLHTD